MVSGYVFSIMSTISLVTELFALDKLSYLNFNHTHVLYIIILIFQNKKLSPRLSHFSPDKKWQDPKVLFLPLLCAASFY
jgi:hypothetical protein